MDIDFSWCQRPTAFWTVGHFSKTCTFPVLCGGGRRRPKQRCVVVVLSCKGASGGDRFCRAKTLRGGSLCCRPKGALCRVILQKLCVVIILCSKGTLCGASLCRPTENCVVVMVVQDWSGNAQSNGKKKVLTASTHLKFYRKTKFQNSQRRFGSVAFGHATAHWQHFGLRQQPEIGLVNSTFWVKTRCLEVLSSE